MLSRVRFITKCSPLNQIFSKNNSHKVSTLSRLSSFVPVSAQKMILTRDSLFNLQIRHKKNKTKAKKPTSTESETGTDDDFEEETDGLNSKILNVHVSSMRADLMIKAGLGIARNKVETLFYESKIRVNGEKLLKKSTPIAIGDEIDVVRGPSDKNPNFTNVSRVEVLSANEKGDGFGVKLRRYKSLLVDNTNKQT